MSKWAVAKKTVITPGNSFPSVIEGNLYEVGLVSGGEFLWVICEDDERRIDYDGDLRKASPLEVLAMQAEDK